MSAIDKSFLALTSILVSRHGGGDGTIALTLVQVIVALNITSVTVQNKKLKSSRGKPNNICLFNAVL